MYLIDTNIHAAYLLQDYEDDRLTGNYLAMYEKVVLADRVVPDFVLGEFETFMLQVVPSRYRLGKEDKQKLKLLVTDSMGRLIRECTLVVPDVSIVQRAWDIYFKNIDTHYLSFVDCLILGVAEKWRYGLLTRDERMKLVARNLGIGLLETLGV